MVERRTALEAISQRGILPVFRTGEGDSKAKGGGSLLLREYVSRVCDGLGCKLSVLSGCAAEAQYRAHVLQVLRKEDDSISRRAACK